MLRYMLDTDICIYAMRNRAPKLRARFNRMSEQLCISTVTLGELFYGAEKSAHTAENLRVVEAFSARLAVLAFDAPAASAFGQIRAALERKGRTIGGYDLMIAGHARSQGMILVTNNEREFARIEGLRVENWASA
jgi:tRNA(fMet)-specific endonuclease VapC